MSSTNPSKENPIVNGKPTELSCKDGDDRQFNGLNIHPHAIVATIESFNGNTRLGNLVDESKTHINFRETFLKSPFYEFCPVRLEIHPRNNPNHNKIGVIVPTESDWVPEYSMIGDDTVSQYSVYVPANENAITIREIAVESEIVDSHYIISSHSTYKLKETSIDLQLVPDRSIKEILQNEYADELIAQLI